jgi:hypothetical protein
LIGSGDGQRGEPLAPDTTPLLHAVYLVELRQPDEVITWTIHNQARSKISSEAR